MRTSPMSNVQSPKSEDNRSTPTVDYVESRAEEPVIGHRRLDTGPQADFGLTVTDLRKSFSAPSGERLEVLRGISFSAVGGEVVAIIGSSGAGKSTLLHLLGGLEVGDHGSIVAGHFAIERATPLALAHFRNRQVGFVYQFHNLLPDLTATENVGLPLLISRTNRRQAMRRATDMLTGVGLGSRVATSVVGHLSGGEQQRVAVCRALITRPALVLADEPTGNLDMTIGDEIARSLVSYARNNRALVIVATHNRALAKLGDRTLILRDGRLCSV